VDHALRDRVRKHPFVMSVDRPSLAGKSRALLKAAKKELDRLARTLAGACQDLRSHPQEDIEERQDLVNQAPRISLTPPEWLMAPIEELFGLGELTTIRTLGVDDTGLGVRFGARTSTPPSFAS
jgi:hypothetical protein